MTTVKVKYRPSSVNGKKGTLYYQVIHKRVARQIKSGHKLFPEEWDREKDKVTLPLSNEKRDNLCSLAAKITEDMAQLEKIIDRLEKTHADYTTDSVVKAFFTSKHGGSLYTFMWDTVKRMRSLDKAGIAANYASTLRSFMKFRKDADISFEEITSDMMIEYEAFLKHNGVGQNTSSFYMRNLQAVYNRAVEKKLTAQNYPFKHVYTGVGKTVKRAIPLHIIRKLKGMDLSPEPTLEYARDMFLFSFYTRGMSFVDMAYLKKKDLSGGILSYRRRKTGQQLYVKWEDCMQTIVDRYAEEDSQFLLPIIKTAGKKERGQYKNVDRFINRKLKEIAKRLKLSIPLTMYVARHTWASTARSKNIPISVISESMGHDSETTTRIYLASLDTSVVDKANKLIIKSV